MTCRQAAYLVRIRNQWGRHLLKTARQARLELASISAAEMKVDPNITMQVKILIRTAQAATVGPLLFRTGTISEAMVGNCEDAARGELLEGKVPGFVLLRTSTTRCYDVHILVLVMLQIDHCSLVTSLLTLTSGWSARWINLRTLLVESTCSKSPKSEDDSRGQELSSSDADIGWENPGGTSESPSPMVQWTTGLKNSHIEGHLAIAHS
ncbi:hypothetical protein NM688_g671 [Phlebia brevispora]|uniref:Uncharacterized protein n=1 Tax=Phlebia brevispora TaxID=194682 RepID=A0ACC1TDP3_9APHY|nr:hypothetical protein NM688_g671 [Phlebia brevispora]